MGKSYFNNKPVKPAKRRKRPNKWLRVLSEQEWEFMRRTHKYGVLPNIIAQIFTIDEEIVMCVLVSQTHPDYMRRITKQEGEDERKKVSKNNEDKVNKEVKISESGRTLEVRERNDGGVNHANWWRI